MNPAQAIEIFDEWMRQRRMARRTRESYLGHASRFAKFRADGAVSAPEKVCAYLSWLAKNRSAVTQKQALCALVALYNALGKPLGTLPSWVRPRERQRVPVWVTPEEAVTLIGLLPSPWNEIAGLMFGAGLRIGEAVSLRSKDLDSATATVTVRSGKGDKDRVTILPKSMIPPLAARYRVNRAIWEADRRANKPGVMVPDTVARKIPRAGKDLAWFWVFPSPGESTDPETGIVRRHHRHEDGFSKALARACALAGLHKRITAHSFRHGFATAYLMNGGNIRELSELMGHTDIRTTEIYLHCLPQLAARATSPLDSATNIIPIRRSA